MPRVSLPDGNHVTFPDGMSSDAMNSEIEDYWSKKHAPGTPGAALPPGPAAHPAVDMKVPSLASDLQNSLDSETRNVNGVTPLPKRLMNDAVATAAAPIVHPIKSLKSLLPDAAPSVAEVRAQAANPDKPTLAEAATDAAGGLIGGAAYAPLAEAGLEPAGAILNKSGNLVKSAGSFVSRVGAGVEAPGGIVGDAGRALSENRIVGASPKSLAKKVGATVGPASEARDAILQKSTAAPTDISGVTQPFDDIAATKLDPRTGAAQPSAIKRLNTTKKAITNVADESGSATGDLKDPNLSPSEMGKLQKNVYGMTDYVNPDSDLANQGLKGTAANLKAAIDKAAPEATPFTDNIHNLLSAEDQLKAKGAPGEIHSAAQIGTRALKAGRTLGGTAAGAGLDMVGNGLKSLGGAIRRAPVSSPVAPEAPADVAPSPAAPKLLGSPSGSPEAVPGSMDGRPAPVSTVTPPPVKPKGLLEQVSGPGDTSPVAPSGIPHPGAPDPDAARMRVTPTEFAPEQGGNAFGHRKLIIGPDGTIRPAPIPLAAPAPTPQLESATGRATPSARPGLLSRLRGDMEAGAAGHQADIAASRAKLAAVPEGKVPDQPTPPAPAAKKLSVPAPSAPSRLPDSHDIDGWEKLVDDGKAHYDVKSHQYVFDGGKRA